MHTKYGILGDHKAVEWTQNKEVDLFYFREF